MSIPTAVRSPLLEQSVAVDLARQGAALIQAKAEEARLRQLALQEYEQTGSKTLAPGVGIRLTREGIYARETAVAWAKEKDVALLLDVKAFEKIALATSLPFVQVQKVPSATLAKDLGAALKAAV